MTDIPLGPELLLDGPCHVLHEGRRLLYFAGNDYHRLATHPDVVEALAQAAREWGTNVAGSRSTTANHPVYAELEGRLAAFLGGEDAVVVSSGYLSNLVAIQALGERFTHLFLDEKAHSSLADAAAASGLPVARFPHRDPDALASALRKTADQGFRPLALTDGVFAATGEIAPLAEYLQTGEPWDLRLLVDDAHGVGTLGPSGAGAWEHAAIPREALVQTGTLCKGLGGFGGFVCADAELCRHGHTRSMAFVGSTPAPPPTAAAALRSLALLRDGSGRIAALQARSEAFKSRLRQMGFRPAPGPAPICSVTFGDPQRNAELGRALREAGILPPFIDYPGSPPGGHFRFTMTSAHEDADVEMLASVLAEAVERIGPPRRG